MKRILLVDDEQLITLAIAKMIERSKEDYEVVGTAANGQQALDFLEKNPVDIALVDIQMPVLSGTELLEKICEKNLAVHVIILSAFRDFAYAQKAIRYGASDYLLKPISQEDLMNTLSAVSQLVDQEQETQTAHSLFSYKKRQKAIYGLLETGISDSEYLPDYLKGEAAGRLLLLTSPIEFPQPFIEDCHELGWEPYRDFQQIYFLPEHLDKEETVTQIAKQTMNLTKDYFLPSLTISQSSKRRFVSDLPQSVVECKVASMYSFYLPEKLVIDYSSIHLFGLTSMRPIVSAFEELHNYIKLSSYNNILKKLEQIYYSLKVEMGLNPQTLYQLFYEMFVEFQLLEKQQRDSNIFSGITLSHLHNYTTLDTLYEYTASLIKGYFDGAAAPTVDHDEQIVETIKVYCKENYAADCTLDDMAATVFISKSYLSQIFKDRCGTSIWNYFTDIRIEKAKELLSSSEIKVNQIGEMVGFRNPSHFGRIFRNHVGVSPKEYRQRI